MRGSSERYWTARGPAGARAAIILNAAAAVYVSGRIKTYQEGVDAATTSIDSGHAKSVLERLKLAYAKPLKARA